MLGKLSARRKAGTKLGAAASELYERAVAHAREPAFYAGFGVPDSIDGRFDLVTLHVHLICRRLSRIGPSGARLAQAVFDAMFRDMEGNLRELGVGDPSVPKRVRAMAEAYFGRAKAYDAALIKNGDALAAALLRNVYAGAAMASAGALAAYVRSAARNLDIQTDDDLLAGRLTFIEVPR